MGLFDKKYVSLNENNGEKTEKNGFLGGLFSKKEEPVKEAAPAPKKDEEIPAGHIKCPDCGNIYDKKELGALKICPKCARYYRLNSKERVRQIADKDSFKELDSTMQSKNPLNYPDYETKISTMQEKTGLKDAVLTGECTIGGFPAVLGVMDSGFMMGSMGSVVGEKLTRAFE
jgi:acetyl-CoA carboxylase carboxyl transferase subunit beta